MMCVCGHPAHHHLSEKCATVTVTGAPAEEVGQRTEILCNCKGFEAADV